MESEIKRILNTEKDKANMYLKNKESEQQRKIDDMFREDEHNIRM